MEIKLRNTSSAARHRKSKLRMDDALEDALKPESEEDVDDTSNRSLKLAGDTAKTAGRATVNEVSKARQRKAVRDAQIASAQKEKMAKEGIENTGNFIDRVSDAVQMLWLSASQFVKKHPASCALAAVGILFLMLFSGVLTSCSAFVSSGTGSVVSAVYTAEDSDILAVNADYTALEQGLRADIENTPATHPGYDEYVYQLEDIGHNPYELASYLTVVYGSYTRAEVQHELPVLLEGQYELTYEESSETRYREETRTRIVEQIDPETGETIQVEEEYTVQVPYTWRILTVKLENHSMRRAVGFSGLSEDEIPGSCSSDSL